MNSEELPEFLEAVNRLLELLIGNFGAWPTVALIVVFIIAAFGFRYYNDRRRDREIDLLIAEKDKTIQRLAESERMYRALFLRQQTDWSDEQIEQFILKNEFSNPVEARQALEDSGTSGTRADTDRNKNDDNGNG